MSLLLFSIILGRLIFVEILKSVFEKSIQSSEPKSERDLGHLTEGINNLKMRLREAETKEILALTEDFPNVFIDYDEDTKQYKITYKNKTASFSTYLEIRTWLEHG